MKSSRFLIELNTNFMIIFVDISHYRSWMNIILLVIRVINLPVSNFLLCCLDFHLEFDFIFHIVFSIVLYFLILIIQILIVALRIIIIIITA